MLTQKWQVIFDKFQYEYAIPQQLQILSIVWALYQFDNTQWYL